jgi:hypothetical protein
VRQGFPLSPLLSVLCIEILAVNIRTSPNVTGVYLPDSIEQYKCSGYADDTTIAVTMDESIEEVFSIYDTFEEASGAKLNRGKSKGMCLGAWKSRNDTPFGLSWVKELPLLGSTFSVGNYTIPTWEKPVARLESRLYAWSGRSLSLQGKTTIINVLALSQIWHLCHVFAIPAWASKRITKALWSFFWSGKKDLVARTTVCLPKSRGGFGVIHFERKAESFALQWVKRFFAPERTKWKSFFKFYITSCLDRSPQEAFKHIHASRLLNALPPFYRIIFRTLRELDGDRARDELGIFRYAFACIAVLLLQHISSWSTKIWYCEPNCVLHFYGDYGPLHWPQTWAQLHITTLDRFVIDLMPEARCPLSRNVSIS